MVIQMKLQDRPFNKIKNGTKTIEMRLFDEKRKHITNGDIIEFTNISTGDRLTTRVVGVHIYPTFKELYRDYSPSELGYDVGEIADPKDMEKYYPVEEQQKYCVVGLEVRVADDVDIVNIVMG